MITVWTTAKSIRKVSFVAKPINRIAKIEFEAGKAKPGPELASLGINMPQFCVKFNEATKSRAGDVVPVIIYAYKDKTFDFILKTTPTAILLKKAAKIEKGSSNTKETVATISEAEIAKIANYKMVDLNTNSLDQAVKIIKGSARSMGIKIAGKDHE